MLLVLLVAGGCASGVVVSRRFKPQLSRRLAGVRLQVVKQLLEDGRRALMVSHSIVRVQLARAFITTAKRYAPVPLTFGHAALANYGTLLFTATGGSLIMISLARAAVQQARKRGVLRAPGADAGLDVAEQHGLVVCLLEASVGLGMYVVGKDMWMRGPLRGGLNVFGACPDLDTCASKERYLMEKLVEFSVATRGGIASLVHLSNLRLEEGAVTSAMQKSVQSMIGYAKRSLGMQNFLVSPEFSEAWEQFAVGTAAHRADMRGIANKVYYPTVPGLPGIGQASAQKALMVINATRDVKRFAAGSADTLDVLGDLSGKLKATSGSRIAAFVSSLAFGFAVGGELDAWLP